jgi:DNA-binding PadR family transcriptional regulator
MNNNYQKETQTKLTKGLLDMIVLQYLTKNPCTDTRSSLKSAKALASTSDPAPSTPLLGLLEKKGYVTSAWNMDTERPRKMYKLTNEGKMS